VDGPVTQPGAFCRAFRFAAGANAMEATAQPFTKGTIMTLSSIALTPLISLIAGVLILIMPRLLNYIVAIYLIAVGLLGLFPQMAG
jgi:hypothetical protein